jgi:hypothetical protein
MGKIGSLLTGFTDGSLRTVEDELTRYNRKDVASKRLVSRHWARTIPLGVTFLYAKGKAPACSMISLDSVTLLKWNTTDTPAYMSTYDEDNVTPRSDPETLLDLQAGRIASALSKLKKLILILPAGEVSITGLVDGLAAHGVLTGLTIHGYFSSADDVLRDVAKLTSLEYLEVNAVRGSFTDEGIMALSSMTGLTSLHLTGGKGVTASGIRTLTSSLTGLKSLILKGFHAITDENLGTLAELAEVGNLGWMDINGSPHVTRGGWNALKDRLRPLMKGFDALQIYWRAS